MYLLIYNREGSQLGIPEQTIKRYEHLVDASAEYQRIYKLRTLRNTDGLGRIVSCRLYKAEKLESWVL